jgi:endonuclease/exonuclease/phosphatase (EEP) superfamily protein YafD
MSRRPSIPRGALVAGAIPLLAACVTLTADPRALIYEPAGIRVQTLSCTTAAHTARSAATAGSSGSQGALDPNAIRILTWNIHKEDDAGWQADLSQLARSNDVLLLQEVTLLDSLQDVLRDTGLRWIMASSFIHGSADIGVLTATRSMPVANCTQRFVEPLVQLPKSAVISWLPLAGTTQTLAVGNVHAINFSLSLGTYRAQLSALADALADHEGPIVLGGDLNTWSDDRAQVVREIAGRLGLVEVTYPEDGRTRFLGKQVDHLLVRGLDVVASRIIAVTSSDHNPVEALLRTKRDAGQNTPAGSAYCSNPGSQDRPTLWHSAGFTCKQSVLFTMSTGRWPLCFTECSISSAISGTAVRSRNSTC